MRSIRIHADLVLVPEAAAGGPVRVATTPVAGGVAYSGPAAPAA